MRLRPAFKAGALASRAATAPFTTTRVESRLTEPKAPAFATEHRARSRSSSQDRKQENVRFRARPAPTFAPPPMLRQGQERRVLTKPESPQLRSDKRSLSRSLCGQPEKPAPAPPNFQNFNMRPVPNRLQAGPMWAATAAPAKASSVDCPLREGLDAHDRAVQAASAREAEVRAAAQEEKKHFTFFAKPRGPLGDATNVHGRV